MIEIEDFKKVEIKIGEIKSVERIEGSDKLLKLSVDFGEESPRQVLSGIGKYFSDLSDLEGVKAPFVTNLPPREMMGLKSEAMIMAVSSESKFSLLKVSNDIPAGSRIS